MLQRSVVQEENTSDKIVGLSLSFANLCVIGLDAKWTCWERVNAFVSQTCEEGTAAVVPWNWCGIIGSFTQRRPTAFQEMVVEYVCLITDTVVPTKKASRKLLAGVVTDTI